MRQTHSKLSGLRVWIVGLAAVLLVFPPSCGKDAGDASDIAERLVDALDFEGGTEVDAPPPEASDLGPAIGQASFPSTSIDAGVPFTVTLQTTAADVKDAVVRVMKDGRLAGRHIVVAAEPNADGMVTLNGVLNGGDDRLLGQRFYMGFALRNSDNIAGPYQNWDVLVNRLNLDISPLCRDQVEAAKEQYAQQSEDNSCIRACANDYYDCLIASNCANADACAGTIQDCLRPCYELP